jgi:hypothetical protein
MNIQKLEAALSGDNIAISTQVKLPTAAIKSLKTGDNTLFHKFVQGGIRYGLEQ